jgi:hypothetical protein
MAMFHQQCMRAIVCSQSTQNCGGRNFPDWPKTGDSLFSGSGDWNAEAVLGVFDGNGLYEYATAYKDAADALVEGVLSHRLVADSTVYPVLYLYRHYVELILKGINHIGEQLHKTPNQSLEGHRIDDLWQTVRPQLEQAFPEAAKAVTDAVEKCIREWAEIDGSGEAFRYAGKRQSQGGGQTLTRGRQVNLAHLREVMNGLSMFLDGSYDKMSELLRCQCDMNADLNSVEE